MSFEIMCEEYGQTPLKIEELGESERRAVEDALLQFQEIARIHAQTRNPSHHVEIGFVDDRAFNAFAVTWQQKDYIAINVGVLSTLRANFDAMSKHPFFFVDATSAAQTATFLYECAKHFIFLHEYAHIFNGHTSLAATYGAPLISEVSKFNGTTIGTIDFQTMEMDADGFGVANIFRLASGNATPTLKPELILEIGAESIPLLYLSSMSLYSVFRLFYHADDEFDYDTLHPSPPVRQYMIAGTLVRAAIELGSYTVSDAVENVVSGAVMAERYYSELAGHPFKAHEFEKMFKSDGWAYSKNLLKNWRSLHPILDKLKRGGVLPPPQDDLDDNP